jgi:hypothetical protein
VKDKVNAISTIPEKAESLFEINRRNKIKHTKKIYTVCATYHPELNLLAVALIDREVRLYRLLQQGAKLLFQEHFSFTVRDVIVTSLHLEQYVVNSRPILCVGKANGDIAIFYVDVPAPKDTFEEELLRKAKAKEKKVRNGGVI